MIRSPLFVHSSVTIMHDHVRAAGLACPCMWLLSVNLDLLESAGTAASTSARGTRAPQTSGSASFAFVLQTTLLSHFEAGARRGPDLTHATFVCAWGVPRGAPGDHVLLVCDPGGAYPIDRVAASFVIPPCVHPLAAPRGQVLNCFHPAADVRTSPSRTNVLPLLHCQTHRRWWQAFH